MLKERITFNELITNTDLGSEAYDYLENCTLWLGSGSFCSTFLHPTDSNIVIKYTEDNNSDVGHIYWATTCLKQTDTIFPKVFSVLNGLNYAVILQEKLYPLHVDELTLVESIEHVTDYYEDNYAGPDCMGLANYCTDFDDFLSKVNEAIKFVCIGKPCIKEFMKQESVMIFLRKLYIILCELSLTYSLDIHNENLMRRRNGELVLLDPII